MRGGVFFGIIQGMEKAATDIYTFEKLREWGFVYVDKTAISGVKIVKDA